MRPLAARFDEPDRSFAVRALLRVLRRRHVATAARLHCHRRQDRQTQPRQAQGAQSPPYLKRLRNQCERIAQAACRLAMKRRKHLSIVHKANVLKTGDGMFLKICRDVARGYAGLAVDDVLVDAMMAHVVRQPERFDVIVATNMFGDILSDLTAELSGSLGLGGSLNVGDSHAMAQAAHGSAPDIAGQDTANPVSLILSTALLLAWHGEKSGAVRYEEAGRAIEAAVAKAIGEGRATRDVGGRLGTVAA